MYLNTVNGTGWLNSLCVNTADLRSFASSLTNWNAGWGAEFSLSARDNAAITACPANKRAALIQGLYDLADDIDSGGIPDVGMRIVDVHPGGGNQPQTHWVLHIDAHLDWPTLIVVTSCWIEITKS